VRVDDVCGVPVTADTDWGNDNGTLHDPPHKTGAWSTAGIAALLRQRLEWVQQTLSHNSTQKQFPLRPPRVFINFRDMVSHDAVVFVHLAIA
jgi:hypothetical protein